MKKFLTLLLALLCLVGGVSSTLIHASAANAPAPIDVTGLVKDVNGDVVVGAVICDEGRKNSTVTVTASKLEIKLLRMRFGADSANTCREPVRASYFVRAEIFYTVICGNKLHFS